MVCELHSSTAAHTHNYFRYVCRGHVANPFGGRVWLCPAAATLQLALYLLPTALAAAGCGENVIYALATAPTNATYALPAIKHFCRVTTNVNPNRLNKLSAYLVLHVH